MTDTDKIKLPDEMPKTVPTELILQFIASLHFAGRMRDVLDYVDKFLRQANIELEANYLDERPYWDTLRALGVTTLYGTTLEEFYGATTPQRDGD